ncbi:Uncharacterised protein [Vibrio cholerae]|uniref:Uncharacterized protein n=1 Tax=Vibrio cholerae TaxID=666 RepID=A0A655QHZ3_VIBCL|nr:Uncharacterised protein [Vibrio cholerae]CSA72674.1 Uncharacterised protein [Vibrio cholerae]
MPTFDNLIQAKTDGFTTFNRAIKHRTIKQLTMVMHFHAAFGPRMFSPRSRLQHFVLQTTIGSDDVFALSILSQKLLPSRKIGICRLMISPSTVNHETCEQENN